jgi:hypothetical protein
MSMSLGPDRRALSFQVFAQHGVAFVGWWLQRQHLERGEDGLHLAGETRGTTFRRAETQFGRDDESRPRRQRGSWPR